MQDAVLQSWLRHRGPDAQNAHEVEITSGLSALFSGFTLHFRGNLTPQPLWDSHGNILLWNGEVFGGIQVNIHTCTVISMVRNRSRNSDLINRRSSLFVYVWDFFNAREILL